MVQSPSRSLEITAVRAKNLADRTWLEEQDPDLVFYVQFEKRDALVAFGNSTKPGCNQTVKFDQVHFEDPSNRTLEVLCFHKSAEYTDNPYSYIGACQVDIGDALLKSEKGYFEGWFQLVDEGHESGEVFLKFELSEPAAGPDELEATYNAIYAVKRPEATPPSIPDDVNQQRMQMNPPQPTHTSNLGDILRPIKIEQLGMHETERHSTHMGRNLLVTPINNSSSYGHSRHTLAKKEKLHSLSSPQEVLPIHDIGQGVNLSNNASVHEHVQALRAVSKHLPPTLIAPAKAEEIFYVECQVEPSTQKDVVLWDDILQAFEGAVHVRHQAKVVPFLKGPDFRPLQPRRIIAVPNTVLDVIVSGELVNTVVPQGPRSMSFHENSEGTMKAKQDNDFQENTVSNTASTGVRRNPVYGLENTAMDAYRDNDNPDWAPRPRAPQTIPSEEAGDSSAPGSHEPNNSTRTMRAPQETVSAVPRDFTQTTFNAGLGDKDAQVALGAMYEDGKVIPQDYQAAMDWYSKAAEQGDSEGQRRVGLFYALGLGVAQDITLAIDWCRKAANQGNFAAEVDVGHLYYYSLGPLQDFQWAMTWYITAAHHGVAVAQHHVGLLFENGQGTPQDDSQALHWYQRAANQGFAKSQSKLGLMYYKGRGGLPQDYIQAMKWCLKAAEQGHAQTQTHVGYMYQSGQGAARDYVQAVKWYRLAADQGEAAAQYNIGILYSNGFGVARDVGKAVEWYRKAADQGFAKAKEAMDALELLGHKVA